MCCLSQGELESFLPRPPPGASFSRESKPPVRLLLDFFQTLILHVPELTQSSSRLFLPQGKNRCEGDVRPQVKSEKVRSLGAMLMARPTIRRPPSPSLPVVAAKTQESRAFLRRLNPRRSPNRRTDSEILRRTSESRRTDAR